VLAESCFTRSELDVGAIGGEDTRAKGTNRNQSTKPNPSTDSLPLTLDDEMDARCLGVIVCLHGAGVGALIVHVHVLDLDAVLGFGVGQEHHSGVQAPLVVAGIEDAAAVQPGHAGDSAIHGAPGEKQRGDSSARCSRGLCPPSPAPPGTVFSFAASSSFRDQRRQRQHFTCGAQGTNILLNWWLQRFTQELHSNFRQRGVRATQHQPPKDLSLLGSHLLLCNLGDNQSQG